MLHLFIGINTAAAKTRARKSVRGEAVFFGEGAHAFETALTYLSSRGLFSENITLILDRPFETTEGKALLEAHAQALHESSVDVYVIETSLSAEQKKFFPKNATVEDFGKAEKEERLLPFALSDAFMSGDRKNAWIEYQKLMSHGMTPEEIHGTLSWVVRSALLAAKTKSATEAGLKPFVYTKSKRVAEKHGIAHVEELSRRLVALYHSARAGEGALALLLESFLLEKH